MNSAAAPLASASTSGRRRPVGARSTAFPGALPPLAGLGVRFDHVDAWLERAPEVGFAEIHAENFMMAGGPAFELLDAVCEQYPLSLHGVALSLGGTDPLDLDHLARLRRLVERCQPASFSEHLAWSSHEGVYFNDLLPVAYDSPTLRRVAEHIDQTQEALGMTLLLENPSTYVEFAASDWDEVDFLEELARRTGCGLLLDVNNVVVSAANHGFSASYYVHRFPLHRVGEIHIAGHDEQRDAAGVPVLIDSHGSDVAETTWALLDQALELAGPRPVLLERDNDVPAIEELRPELERVVAALTRVEMTNALAS